MTNARLIDQTRDKVYENADSLTAKKAQRLFEEPFNAVLRELDDDTRDEIFTTAKNEVDAMMNGNTSWTSTFNTYVEIANLVELIREAHAPENEAPLSELAQEVSGASNRISTLFYVLRTNKDLSEAAGQAIIEAAFPLAVRGLTAEAKKAIFSYVYERNSGLGWGQVAEEYTKFVDLIVRVKPDGLAVNDSTE